MADIYLNAPTRQKRGADVKPFTLNLRKYLRAYWRPGRSYGTGNTVRAPSAPGFAYQALTDGESGATEPNWAGVLGGQTNDGSIKWQAITPVGNALDPIAGSPLWLAPGALNIVAQSNTSEEATAAIGGGAQATYRIVCMVTTASGKVYTIAFDLEVDSGASDTILTPTADSTQFTADSTLITADRQ